MARRRTLVLGVVNIKTHPHSPEKYAELFGKLFELKIFSKIRGSDWGMPHYIDAVVPGNSVEGLYGDFYKYLEIDANAPWVSLKERKLFLDKDGRPIPQIDEDRRPNTKSIPFVFIPKGHRMFFEIKHISPKNMKSLLDGLFSANEITSEYGLVDVEVESSKEVITLIKSIPVLSKLDIIISRPNVDDISGLKGRIYKRYEKLNLRKVHIHYDSDKNDGMTLDDESLALMDLGTSDGVVSAEGYDNCEKIEVSTKDHPFIKREKYDPEEVTFVRALINMSKSTMRLFNSREA